MGVIKNDSLAYFWQHVVARINSSIDGIKSSLTPVSHNLLDNSNFCNIVNQRGKFEYTGAGHIFDRWRTVDETAHVTVEGGAGIVIDTPIMQVISMTGWDTSSNIYTAAVCGMDGTVTCVSGILKTSFDEETGEITEQGFGNDTITVGFYSAIQARAMFRIEKPGTYRWAALYKGSYTKDTLPLYVAKSYSQELLECQRYLVKLTVSRHAVYCTKTGIRASIPLPTKMYSPAPSITYTKLGEIRCPDINAITVTGISVNIANDNAVWIDTTHASTEGITSATGTWNGAEFMLSAEL